jgi:hypothetical protein
MAFTALVAALAIWNIHAVGAGPWDWSDPASAFLATAKAALVLVSGFVLLVLLLFVLAMAGTWNTRYLVRCTPLTIERVTVRAGWPAARSIDKAGLTRAATRVQFVLGEDRWILVRIFAGSKRSDVYCTGVASDALLVAGYLADECGLPVDGSGPGRPCTGPCPEATLSPTRAPADHAGAPPTTPTPETAPGTAGASTPRTA